MDKSNDMTATMRTYTCIKGTPGPVGTTNEIDFNIQQLNVIAQTINPVTTVPNSLVSETPSYNQMLQRIGAGITIRY